MITSPIQAIEAIAKSEDRSRAIVFFLFFARFEYALKRTGFVTLSADAKANWTEYAQRHSELLERNSEERLGEAVAYLEKVPPKKQIVDSSGYLRWSDDFFTGSCDLARVFTLVRRIRNNLFHGGKFPEGPENDISRDRMLLDAGLVVMQACLDSDERLRTMFLDHLEDD